MNKTESYIEAVTEFLAKPRKVSDMSVCLYTSSVEDEFRLEGHRFAVAEAEYSNVMTFAKMRLITVRAVDFTNIGNLDVRYEPDFWGCKDDTKLRIKACYELATKLVKEMLPKVDYRFKTQVHNDGIEEILEALE